MFNLNETVVVHKGKEEHDIDIQRGTIWGNPFTLEEYSREKAIFLYYFWLLNQIKTCKISLNELQYLKGKRLGCTCKPKKCHGDILVHLVNFLNSNIHSLEEKEKVFGVDKNLILEIINEY